MGTDTHDTAPDAEGQEPDAAEGQEPSSGQQGKTYDETYVSSLRSEAAKHRRELAEAKAALQKIEDAKKSDLEKATGRAEAAERRLAELEARELRRTVAAEVGLDPSLADRIHGDDEDALRKDAKALLEKVGGTKRVDLDAGPKGEPAKGEDDWLRARVVQARH